jgi:hypothetical protein
MANQSKSTKYEYEDNELNPAPLGDYRLMTIDTKPKSLTYREAQKRAMERGDASTYFMRKTSKKNSRKRGKK